MQKCILPTIFALDLLEDWDVADGGKKQDTGSNFDGVIAKNVIDGGFAVEHNLADLHQSLAKYWMLNVGLGLFSTVDAIEI